MLHCKGDTVYTSGVAAAVVRSTLRVGVTLAMEGCCLLLPSIMSKGYTLYNTFMLRCML